jgi:hypothetical protein
VYSVIRRLDNEDLENSAVYGSVYVAIYIESKSMHGAQSIPSREIMGQ